MEDFQCIECFGNAKDALAGIPALKPDVILMDINLPDTSGVECVGLLMQDQPNLKILMFTAFENSKDVFAALKAGASGYIVKRRSFEELLNAIRNVLDGGAPMTSNIARKVVQSFHQVNSPLQQLTKREEEVLNLVAKGLQNKEVAEQLNISTETVRVHLRNIYDKWQVSNRAEAAATYTAMT